MELQDNICDKYIKKKIYKIQLVSKEIHKNYIFIGGINKTISPILNLIEQNKPISKADKLIISNYYGDIFGLIEPNTKFVPSFINEDDSIKTIKKKILIYLSNTDTNTYYNIKNQLLYIKQSKINTLDKYQIKSRLEENFPNIKFSELKENLKSIMDISISCSSDISSLEKQKSTNNRITNDKIKEKTEKCQNMTMNNNYHKLLIKSRLLNIGVSFQNNTGKKIHLVSPYLDNESTAYLNNIDINDILIDESSNLLSSYGEIDNNTIYLVDYATASKELDPDILYPRIMFPFLNEEYTESESEQEYLSYQDIIKNYDDIINNFENIYFNYHLAKLSLEKPELELNKHYNDIPDLIYNFNKCTIINATYYINYGNNSNLDIGSLFNKSIVNKNVPFIRYKNLIDNQYKVHIDSIYNKIKHKNITSKFTSSNKYLVKYQPFYFNSDISLKLLEKWKVNNISIRERQFIKNEKELDRDYINRGNSLKFVFLSPHSSSLSQSSKYNNLIVNDNGYLEMKFSFNEDENVSEKFIKNSINYYHKILSNVGLNSSIKTDINNNVKTILLDTYSEIYLPKIKLSNIEKKCNDLYPFVYLTDSNDSNILKLKWIRTNLLESYDSIKNYFIKLKKTFSDKGVAEFNKLWNLQTKNIFKLSEIESTTTLNSFTETIQLEDFKRMPPEMETDITLEKTNQITPDGLELYKIYINNANNLEENVNIYKFLCVLFFNCYNKKTSVQIPVAKKTENIKILAFKKKDFVDDDALDFEDGLFSDSDEEDSEDETEDQVDLPPIEPVEESSEDESGVNVSVSYRNYFRQNRSKDLELFFFPTDTGFYSPYSIKCGAVDKRQPILLTKSELTNIETTNPEGYKLVEPTIENYKKEGDNLKISKLEWGSNLKKTNFFVCPRIWCTKCKLILTPEQLFESVSHKYPSKFTENEGKCPFCNGSIIQGQVIQENETIFIRKAHDYWADPNTKDPNKKTPLWNKYLKGTEKDAFTSFLDPKLHPKGLCMPCCNSNPLGNYKKCMIIEVSVTTLISKINIKEIIKIGKNIDNYTLLENDLVLVKNQKNVNSSRDNGIYKVTKGDPIKIEKFMDLDLQSGVVVSVKNGKVGKDKTWELRFNEKNELKVVLLTNITDDKYILGVDKFPLGDNKLGLLPETIDKLLLNNSDSYVSKGKPKIGSNLFFRRGINQDSVNSFLTCMASVYGTDVESFVDLIIKEITPDIFVKLNSGDLVNQFYRDEVTLFNVAIFKKWCDTYKDFINKYDKSLKYDIRDNVLLERINQNNKYKRLYRIFYSFEGFKKYCGNLNLYKDPSHFWELFSTKIEWLFNEGLNIIIIERTIIEDEDNINILCPKSSDIDKYLDFEKPFTLLLKFNDLYESIVFTSIKTNKINVYSILNQSISITNEQLSIVKSLGNIMLYNCNEEIDDITTRKYIDIDYNILPSINFVREKLQDEETFKIVSQISDTFNRGIGVILENDIVVLTKPYGIDYSYTSTFTENINTKNYHEILDNLNQLNQKYSEFVSEPKKVIVDENNQVFGILLNSGNVHIVNPEPYQNRKHKLEKLTLNNFISLDKNLIMNIPDTREEYINDIIKNRSIYTNIKNELINFLSIKNKNIEIIKDYLSKIVSNPILELNYKREQIDEVLIPIISFLVNNGLSNYSDDAELCSKKSNKSCSKSKKCSLGDNILNLSVNGKDILIRGTKCKLNIDIKDQPIFDRYCKLLIEEIIRFPNKNKQILNNVNEKTYIKHNDNTILLNDSNFFTYLDNFLKISNIYLNESRTYISQNPNNNNQIIKNISEDNLDLTIRPKSKSKLKKLVLEDNNTKPVKEYPIIMASTTALDGSDYSNNVKFKEGQCIFPWNITRDGIRYKDLDKCMMSKDVSKGAFCATSIFPDNSSHARGAKTYGYCPEGSPYESGKHVVDIMPLGPPKKSTIMAVSEPVEGYTNKLPPNIKPGNCIFPFKDSKGVWKKTCEKSKNKSWRNWCPTSLTSKNKVKTYGYCLEDSLDPSLDANTVTTNQVLPKKARLVIKDSRKKSKKKISRDECKLPFVYKGKEYNDCIETTPGKGKWCPTELKPNRTLKTQSSFAYCEDDSRENIPNTAPILTKKVKKIFTTKYDKYGKHHTGEKIVTGECKFPFSYKRKEYYNCIDTGKGPWCPTSLRGNNLMKTWAYCLPEGVETYAEFKDQTKNSSRNESNVSEETKKYNNWIAKYFNDDKFGIEIISNSSNSLFELISKTLKVSNVTEMRNILADHINDDTLDKLQEIYQKLFEESKDETKSIEDRDIAERYYLDLDFLEDVSNLADLQNFIRTPEFWPNLWALFILEKVFNFKALILTNNSSNIAYCGPDLSTLDDEKYSTDKYIILDIDKITFNLVTYNNKQIFSKLDELPKSIKDEFSDCLKNSPNFERVR